MRDPQRISRILVLINTLWRNNPDWRLMQLLVNVAPKGGDNFYLEDDDLEESLNVAIRKWAVQLELREDDN